MATTTFHSLSRRRSKTQAFTLIEVMIVVGITGIVLAIATPTWLRQRMLSQQRACQENIVKLNGAKEQWALEMRKTPSDTPDMGDLYNEDGSGFLKTEPECPAGGEYTLHSIGEATECDITDPLDHNAPYEDE